MAEPWLAIPLADYEGHMSAPGVAQLGALSDLFAEAVAYCAVRSVAILGIAGGNGLERLRQGDLDRITGIDVNAEYLETVRRRYGHLPLDLVQADLRHETVVLDPVELVYAALIFEHAGVECCLENALALAQPGGFLAVVLQLPSTTQTGVSPTPFPSIQNLREHFQFVDPEGFQATLAARGFEPRHERRLALAGGKAFWLGIFRRP